MSTSGNDGLVNARVLLQRMFDEGVRAVDPEYAVASALELTGSTLHIGDREFMLRDGRVVVIAIGKAAHEMAKGIWTVLGDRISEGYVLTKDGATIDADLPRFRHAVASHPIPDERGVRATGEIIEMVSGLGADDLVIALISGGGSALLEAPRDPLELSDIQATTDLILRAGAPIQDLNAVRSELSRVKGGGLRRAIGTARCVTLILSDVLGNDPAVIASGPTVSRRPNPARALELLDRYTLREHVPALVVALLERAVADPVPPAEQAEQPAPDVWTIIGDNRRFIEEMAAVAKRNGCKPEIIWRDREGEASALAIDFVDACASMPDDVDIVIGGGEATVTVRGQGVGGRNTEFALAAAIELDRRNLRWMVASVASDGDDGANERSAGGVADPGLVQRARAAGLDPCAALRDNDSGTFLTRMQAMMHCDPTGTNVNDAYIAIRLADD